MDTPESNDLFSAISSYLCGASSRAESASSLAFWQNRAHITAAETNMLMLLTQGPLCINSLAAYLRRDAQSTKQFLDALVAIGVLERHGELYANTDATNRYCQSLQRDRE